MIVVVLSVATRRSRIIRRDQSNEHHSGELHRPRENSLLVKRVDGEKLDIVFLSFRLNILTKMNAAEEISEDQARQFQMDLEMCYLDFNKILSTNG